MIPVPGTIRPAPKGVLMVVVMAAALPSASTTETWAVPWSGASTALGSETRVALMRARSRVRRAGAMSVATGTSVNAGSPYQRARSAKPCAMTEARRWSVVGVPGPSAARSSRARRPSISSNTPPEPGGGKVTIRRPRNLPRSGRRHTGR